LELTANSANTLLTTDSVETAVRTALQMIGERLGTDRVNVIENIAPEPGADFPSWRVLYEWDSSGTVPQLSHPETAQGSYGDIQWLYERFQSHRQSVSYNIEDAPEPFRSQQMAIGVKATHIVPIFIDETWWGVVAMDDCQTVQTRDPAELSVLKTAAACIGSAIQRDRTQQTLLAAEQNRVVELAKTNQALKNSLDRLADNPDLDAFLGYVLTEISQQFDGKIATLYHFDPYTQTLNLQQWVEQGVVLTREDLHQFGPMAEPISAVGSTAWDFLLENKFPLVITRDNARQYMFPGTQDWQLEWVNRENLQAGINILLSSGQTPMGMLCMFSAKHSEFTSEELEIAQALSHQATLAIQLTRLAAEAQRAAILGERNRLAREIHDTLAQAFGGVIMQLQAADYFLDSRPDTAWNHVQMAQKLSQDGLDKARRSVWTLYLESTEYEDLTEAIRQFIAEKQTNTTTAIDLHIDGTPYSLKPELGLNLLRIAQEAIVNALRHAQASLITVSLSYTPDHLRLTISDDGQGFSTEAPSNGFGLIGMQQRANKIAAQLQLTSQPQRGTQITVMLSNPMAF
ncbi:MAG: GAF domain-containing sensor histidine kinase, partial [Cyanobacteria bacterium P01_A01_bin.17]